MTYERFTTNGADVLIIENKESLSEMESMLVNFEIYRPAYEKLTTDKRKAEFLGLRIGINELLNGVYEIIYNEDGKPCLKNEQLHISLSHSGKWLAIIAHPTKKVGIDIECPAPKLEKLYKRFLSEVEQEELYKTKNIVKLQIAWSAKEALYKIIGNDAVEFASQLRIFDFCIENNKTLRAQHIPTGMAYELHFKTNNQYTLVYSIA